MAKPFEFEVVAWLHTAGIDLSLSLSSQKTEGAGDQTTDIMISR